MTRKNKGFWFYGVCVSLFAAGLGFVACSDENQSPFSSHVISDNKPAENWELAYPVGNGRLGAMVFGDYPRERILINEETIWAKANPQVMPEDSAEAIAEISELIRRKKYSEADAEFKRRILTGHRPSSYQPFGNLWITHLGVKNGEFQVTRELLLDEGIARTTIRRPNEIITREAVASKNPDLLLVRLETTNPEGLFVKIELDRPSTIPELMEKSDPPRDPGQLESAVLEGSELLLAGQAETVLNGTKYPDGTQFAGRIKLVTNGGEVLQVDGGLGVKAAQELTILVDVATDYNREDPLEPLTNNWEEVAAEKLDRIDENVIPRIVASAVEEHRALMERCRLDLGDSPQGSDQLTTGQRRRRFSNGIVDPELVETYFQFGRYLLISSSQPGTLPANLQGIWNPYLEAPWKSDFHLNINLQMNYWPAEVTNLSELHRPLFEFARMLIPAGEKMARRLGCKGVCTGHATDAWAQARIMSSEVFWGGNFLCWQWVVTHAMEHFRFTQDRDFLREQLWDLQTKAVEFCLSWVQRDPESGLWIAGPSASPENSFQYRAPEGTRTAAVCMGNSFDQFLIRQVLTDYLEAAEVLEEQNQPLVREAGAVLKELYIPGKDSRGRLMEWRYEFEEPEPGHRHISHVLGLYPGNQILPLLDPEKKEAVENTLDARLESGGGQTGWSRAWITGLYARLGDRENAYENLRHLLSHSTLDNLFDSHPPFQIDGNFGGCAAIAEMLIQSHETENGVHVIRLLPALPTQWPKGVVEGLRARGGFEVDMKWLDHSLLGATITASRESQCVVIYGDRKLQVDLEKGDVFSIEAE
jgi:alpha-L-fucosidase 2